jgi:transcription antitermination factor NusG
MSRSPEPPAPRSKRPPGTPSDAAPRLRGRAVAEVEVAVTKGGGARVDREPAPVEASPFERGARVSVLKGPFAGKVGVVQELDGKGGARVMLGLLAVRLDVKNLISAVEGRGRPRLSSSHRKPMPARS